MKRTKPPRDARRRSLATKVGAQAQQERAHDAEEQRKREKADRLDDSFAFDPEITLSDPNIAAGLLKELEPYLTREGRRSRLNQQTRWRADLACLVANLLAGYRAHPEPRVISMYRDVNKWPQPPRYQYPRGMVIELLDALRQQGWADQIEGANFPGRSWVTRAWVLPALLTAHPELDTELVARPPAELIELRDRASDRFRLLDYEDDTDGLREILAEATEVAQRATIRYRLDHERRDRDLCPTIKAVFYGDFDGYGYLETVAYPRLESVPHTYLPCLSNEERWAMTADGVGVTDIRFAALHAHLLYAAQGKQCVGDPYKAVIDARSGFRAGGHNAPMRPTLDAVLFALVQAERDEDVGTVLGTKAGRWIEPFYKAHPGLVHYFDQDRQHGRHILSRGIRILADVLRVFADRGIPILPVRGGFVVAVDHGAELWRVMEETYRRHTEGFECHIPGQWDHNPRNPKNRKHQKP